MSLNLVGNNSRFLDYLDWYHILDNVSSHCHFDYNKEKLKSHYSLKSESQLNAALDVLSKYIDNLDSHSAFFNSIIKNIPTSEPSFHFFSLLSKSKVLDLSEINLVCTILGHYYVLTDGFSHLNINHSYLSRETTRELNKGFIKPFRSFVDDDGTINFKKHPILSKIMNSIDKVEANLRRSIQSIRLRPEFVSSLQHSEHDIVNDRFVLAVRSDNYTSVLGTIVDRSNTGLTLFVEPYELRKNSNLRMMLIAEFEAELQKICYSFTEILTPFFQDINNCLHFIYKLDQINSKAIFSSSSNFTRPVLSKTFDIHLTNFFHPLLENPIKNSVSITEHERGMVISGPNTGGKTVALKSILLCHLLPHIGLFVPAEKAQIHLVPSIYFFSHDQQDIDQGLSSFASEAKNYLELLSTIKGNSLIVIDEIFNSTSSEEASALAISFLDEVNKCSNSKVVISTHHQFFKSYIHTRKDIISAHVGFNEDSATPDYKIYTGSPGSSLAFKIFDILATKFNFKNSITENAERVLDKKHVSYEQLLQEISKKQNELNKLLLENKIINNELKHKKKSMEGLILLEKESIISSYKDKIKKHLEKAETILSDVKTKKIVSEKEFMKQSSHLKRDLNVEKKSEFSGFSKNPPSQNKAFAPEISAGETYFSSILNKKVTVLSINARKKEAKISHLNVTIWTPYSCLLPFSGGIEHSKRVDVFYSKEVQGVVEVDGRGLRLDQFQTLAKNAISELINGDIPFLTIIHGHGTGVLKKWVRDELSNYKELKWFPEDGNDGATKVELS